MRAAGPQVQKSLGTLAGGAQCIIIGTVYKDMKLKPNILDEHHAREVREAASPRSRAGAG